MFPVELNDWLNDMNKICGYSIEEYSYMIEKFHGTLAPGILIGGFMVDLAMKKKPKGELFDFLCETATCLPDAIQLLTPCTYGNGWLKVVDVGRFALTMFEKYTGNGVRVFCDVKQMELYLEIKGWFFKQKIKQQQNKSALISEIIEAGHSILSTSIVQVDPTLIGKRRRGAIGVCPQCGEAYPAKDGKFCLACQGTILYSKILY